MPCQSDIPSSSPQAEHLYDEEAQQQQYPSAPSPTLYSPHSPFTPKTLSSDEPQPPVQKQQQQKYDSLRSTFSSDSSAATNTAVNTPLFASVAQRAKGRGSFRVHGAGVAAHSDDDLPMQSNGSDGFSRGRGEAFSSSTAGPSSPTELRKLMKPTSMLFESSQLPEKSENGKKYITRKKKNKDPSKEAFKINKTLFSNERTFVHWLKFGMLLGGLAMTLLNFSTLSADASIAMGGGGGGSGNNGVGGLGPFGIGTGHAPSKAAPHSGSLNTTETPATKNPEVVAMAIWLGKVGQYVGAFLLLVCMGCLAYSTALFHWRHLGIAKKATDRRYYDRWGPTILTVLLVTVYTVNVYLTMKATSGHESNHQPTPLYNVHPVIGPPTPSESPFVPSPTNINKTGSDGTAGEDGVWAMNPYDTPTPTSRLGPSDAAATAASVPDPASSYDSSSSYDDTEYGYNDEDDDEEEDDEDEERW
ncbi:hypothetical protein BGZ73_002144 [Actinomortierella ambigua]|nr:hypothetical protein BGZ73_002144 [Actinomortierella ambigua]